VLNFLIELTVVRNYTMAVVFITAVALVISTGVHGSSDLGALLLARGVDTAVGCAVAMAVFLLLVPRHVSTWLPVAVADVLDAVGSIAPRLTPETVTAPATKAARRDLQRCALALSQMYDNAVNGSARQRRNAELLWPAIAATERLAYRTVAECWRLERVPASATPHEAAHLADLEAAARTLAEAVRAGRTPPDVAVSAGILSDEVLGVGKALG
jgi:uncharacterized membrane protein YccC